MGGRTAAAVARVLAVGLEPGELEGAVVELADDVLGAIARLADGGVDVVLLALDLPDADGVDAVLEVRERAPDVPVIAVAGPQLASRATEVGASDVVPPDAPTDAFARAVRYAADLHRLRRRRIDDEETGLLNARGFELFATHHVALAARTRIPFVLVTVRVETPGDGSARATAAATAELLRPALRGSDVLARVGPATFRVLLTGEAAGAESLVLARLGDAVAEHNAGTGRSGGPALSIGAATFDPERPSSLEDLIGAAEPAAGDEP